jgi:hypothetical protein
MSEFRYEVTDENESWVYGETFHHDCYFGKWCKYKKGGNAPTAEQLMEIERKRTETAVEYRKNNPWEPSKEYFEAIKKWPIKGN